MKRRDRYVRLRRAACLAALLVTVVGATAGATDMSAAVPRSLLLDYLAHGTAFTLVDARSEGEFAAAHITGAINIPHDSGDEALQALPADTDAAVVVYCKTGRRASLLRKKLLDHGYTNVRILLPRQITWFDGMAVFNCGSSADELRGRDMANLLLEGKREEEL